MFEHMRMHWRPYLIFAVGVFLGGIAASIQMVRSEAQNYSPYPSETFSQPRPFHDIPGPASFHPRRGLLLQVGDRSMGMSRDLDRHHHDAPASDLQDGYSDIQHRGRTADYSMGFDAGYDYSASPSFDYGGYDYSSGFDHGQSQSTPMRTDDPTKDCTPEKCTGHEYTYYPK